MALSSVFQVDFRKGKNMRAGTIDVVLIQLEYETDDQKEWIEGEVAVGMCIDIKAMLEQWEFGSSTIFKLSIDFGQGFLQLGLQPCNMKA